MGDLTTLERLKKLIELLSGSFKDIDTIARSLGVSVRSARTYISNLKKLNYEVVGGKIYGRYSYSIPNIPGGVPFTQQEYILLRRLLETHAKRDPLSQSILSKLFEASEEAVSAKLKFKSRLGQFVESIEKAIHEKKQIKVIAYFSYSKGTSTDRIIEPLEFSANYVMLHAYEPASKKVKDFRLDRMGGVDVLKKSFTLKNRPNIPPHDIFYFRNEKFAEDIQIEMTTGAYILLRDQFSGSIKCVTYDEMNNKYPYTLMTTVHSFAVPTRFVLGLPGEVRVKGCQKFKEYIEVVKAQKWL